MKILIIGSGLQYKRRISALNNDFEIIKFSRSGESDSNTFKKFLLLDLSKIYAAIICNPPSLHYKYAKYLLKNKIPVLCEKPLTANSAEAKELMKISIKYKTLLKCGFNHRYHKSINKAKKLIEDGFLGEIISIRANYGMCGRDGYENEWRSNSKYAIGGHFGEQGIHLIDLVRYLCCEITHVVGMNSIGYFKKQKLEDNGSAILKLSNGAIATITSSMTEWKNSFFFHIFGKDGYIFLNGLGGTYGEQQITYGKRSFDLPFNDQTIYFRGSDTSWGQEWKDFVNLIEKKKLSDESGYKAVNIIENIYKSAKKNKVIKL